MIQISVVISWTKLIVGGFELTSIMTTLNLTDFSSSTRNINQFLQKRKEIIFFQKFMKISNTFKFLLMSLYRITSLFVLYGNKTKFSAQIENTFKFYIPNRIIIFKCSITTNFQWKMFATSQKNAYENQCYIRNKEQIYSRNIELNSNIFFNYQHFIRVWNNFSSYYLKFTW